MNKSGTISLESLLKLTKILGRQQEFEKLLKELMELATLFSINHAKEIISEVKSVIREWEYFADQSGVSQTSRKSIAKRLKEIDG